jgi:hypothetical protein
MITWTERFATYQTNYILMYVEKRTNICKGNLNGQSYIVDLVLKYQPGN